MNKDFFKQCIGELVGTFFLVFVGCGAVISFSLNPEGLPVHMIPLIFGGIVAVMIYALGHISGAHMNPAVTIAFYMTRFFPLQKVFGYIIFQLIGAALASGAHYFIFGPELHRFGATQLALPTVTGFGLEVLLSFLLMFVVTSVAKDTRAVGEMAGMAVGLTVWLCASIGGSLTGASMNPARSFGPALLNGDFTHYWVYVLAPILGATLGAYCYEWVRSQETEEEKQVAPESSQSSEICCEGQIS